MIKPYLLSIVSLLYASLSIAQGDYLIPYRDGSKWGYCDTSRRILIPPQYDYAGFFLAGHGPVTRDTVSYLLDKKGKVILAGGFMIEASTERFTRIDKGERAGLLDVAKGRIVLPPIYKSVYNQGLLAAVWDEKGRSGVFHTGLGKWIVPFDYQNVYLEDNYIIVQSGQERSYYAVSATGDLIKENRGSDVPKEEQFASASYYQSMTLSSKGGKGFTVKTIESESGRVISEDSIPAIYESIDPVGLPPLLIVKKDGRSGMIDMKSKIKIPFLYDEIKIGSWGDGIYAIKKEGKWGLTRFDKILLPCEYDEILADSLYKNGFYLRQGSKKGFYVYSDAKKLYGYIIPCKYENVLSWMYTVGTDARAPFYVLRVNYDGWKDGFVGVKGNEFFR